ncbi:MAG: YfbK domain-containing protein [Kiritimatiellia bacterium]
MNQRCDQEKWLTPFLLGDLTERDEADFSRHLASCTSCQDCARDLSPVLQTLADGLAKDDTTAPRFDLHHQMTLLTVPAENPHRVIAWMARSRPWLVAAASALVVTGLSYFVLFSSMSRQYGYNGYDRGTSAAGAALASRAPTGFWSTDSNGRPLEKKHKKQRLNEAVQLAGRPEIVTDGLAFDYTVRTQSEIPKPVTPGESAEVDSDGLSDGWGTVSGLSMQTPDESAAAASIQLSSAPADTLDTDAPLVRDFDGSFSKLEEKAQIGHASASRVKQSGNRWYESRTAEGRELALKRYGGGPGGVATPPADTPAYAAAGKPTRNKHGGGSVVYGLTSPYPQHEKDSKKDLQEDVVKSCTLTMKSGACLSEEVRREDGPDDDGGVNYANYAFADEGSKESPPAAQNNPQNGGRLAGKDWTVEAWTLNGDKKPGKGSPAKPDTTAPSITKTPPIVLRNFFFSGTVTTNAVSLNAKDPAQNEPAAPRAPRAKATGFNPFVATTENHFSTFSIDVNTASYNLTRQALRSGALPEPDVVRTEEILNAFDYGDTAPDRATFRVYVEGAPSPFGEAGLSLLRIGVKGRRLGREEQRPAMLTFLVDTSGSMAQPNRLGRARTALRLLVDQLGAADQIQIISFDDQARLVLPPTPARQKQAILQAFDRLQCNGSTNLEGGMHRAYQQAAKAFTPGGENRVILISDGVANLGADNAQDILREIEAFRKQGVTCSVFGVGEGTYNDALLEELANKGQGVYRFLDSDEEVKRVFVDDLAATINNIATDVKIQVEWSAEAVRRFRQLGYERRALKAEQFRDDTVDAGEVGSGQSVTALYELDLTPAAKSAALGTVRVRYRRVDTGAVEEIAQPITPEMIAPSLRAARPQFRLAAGAAAFAEKLRGSPYVLREHTDVARLLLPVTQELALDTRVKELLNLVETAATLTK